MVETVDVILNPMSQDEFEVFLVQTTKQYADENIEAGYWLCTEAMERSIAAHQKLLPNGISTEGHYFFSARDTQSKIPVGYIWLSVDKSVSIPSGFIFALLIYEQFRGRGYGKMMMKAIEVKAAELGLMRLMLHVFAQNKIAIRLYEDAGYGITSLNMIREISERF